MEFGRLPSVDQVVFKLPPDKEQTTNILKQANTAIQQELIIGCAKWGRPDWVGKLYPKGTKNKDYLAEYAKHFNSIELNATHYSRFTPEAMQKWDEVTSDDFLFFPKFHQSITHWKRLSGAEIETRQFFDSLSPIKHKVGGYFLQLNEQFGPKNADIVIKYLEELPEREQVFLEFRHPDFFKETPENELFYQRIQDLKVGLLITDTAGRRDCAHMRLTTPKAFIRFVGNSLHPTDYMRMDDWVQRLQYWLNNGLESMYFFMHQHDELYSPEAVVYLIDQLNKECGLKLKPLKLIGGEQVSLF